MRITSIILQTKDDLSDDSWLIDRILDNAKSKGTGCWATLELTEQAIPATMIATALNARSVSAYKDVRMTLGKEFKGSSGETISTDLQSSSTFRISSDDLRRSYAFARIINHVQGLHFLDEGARRHGWDIDLSSLCRIWTNGCIIRSHSMKEFVHIVQEVKGRQNIETSSFLQALFCHPSIKSRLVDYKESIKRVVCAAISTDIAVPCLVEALNFFNAICTGNSSSNLIQAQRDYFGAHHFQRNDHPQEELFHFDWKNL